MTARRLERFTRGQPLASLRPPLNRVVDAINGVRGPLPEPTGALAAAMQLELELRDLPLSGPPYTLTCVLPGQRLNPDARTWTVELGQTLDTLARDTVSYTYTDVNTRQATDGGDTEDQELTPHYLIGDRLIALRIGAGNRWIDANVDGRQWARVP